jgi:hypothetical protein
MTDAFTLVISSDAQMRAIAPEVVSRYAELSGGSAADGAALAAAVSAAIGRIVAGAAADVPVNLAFRPEGAGVHVDLTCGSARETVRITIPVTNR